MRNTESISFFLLKYFVYLQTLQKHNINGSRYRLLLTNDNKGMFKHDKRFINKT